MKIALANPHGNVCRLEIELPWEAAEALIAVGPDLLAALGEALNAHRQDMASADDARAALAKETAQRKAEWAALAADCEAEIARRSNHPAQRQALIKQLAAERGTSIESLSTLLRVNRRERLTARRAETVALRNAGKSNREIAAQLGLSERLVSKDLQNAKATAQSAFKVKLEPQS